MPTRPTTSAWYPREGMPPAGISSRGPRRKDKFWGRGEPMVWVAGGTLAAILLGAVTLFLVLAINGLAYFWPSRWRSCSLPTAAACWAAGPAAWATGKQARSSLSARPTKASRRGRSPKARRGHLPDQGRRGRRSSFPPEAIVVERQENSDFYGIFVKSPPPAWMFRSRASRKPSCTRPCGSWPRWRPRSCNPSWTRSPP